MSTSPAAPDPPLTVVASSLSMPQPQRASASRIRIPHHPSTASLPHTLVYQSRPSAPDRHPPRLLSSSSSQRILTYRPPPSPTPVGSSSASDVYKRQETDLQSKNDYSYTLIQAGATVYEFNTDSNEPYLYLHSKVAVRDSSSIWMSSGNWKPSSVPAPDVRGNVEWSVIIELSLIHISEPTRPY